ncbi:MAG TPA: glycogen debranching protein GlgX, partial [Polyangiales bacterium]
AITNGMRVELGPGRPEPLGARWDGAGVNFALECAVATRVQLCLFEGEHEHRVELARSGSLWHGYVHGLMPGARYGLRVHGPWAPTHGHRCNPHKLLLDPYARALAGEVRWHESLRGTDAFDAQDSAPHVPRAVVVDERFDWEGDRPPRTPWRDSVLYELHVRGFSKRNGALPEAVRGTYAGLAHPRSIAHLLRLGVTAVELLPVHAFVDDAFLVERRLSNYWGYSTLAFFAPAQRYARSDDAVREFKEMVKALHRAGIEVILDVVYNHTCEGNQRGPTLSLKGIDNARYYALERERHLYRDVTGCGNTVDATRAKQLIVDSLRYWVREMHVDGFRFDLATALGRNQDGVFDGALLRELAADPVLAGSKLIAEPWDLGPDGYQLGNFPAPMREWNDKYRDAVRRLWKGEPHHELAQRLRGSPDLFRHGNATLNFVTAHDGFTLRDLVTYARKRNLENGENNRDGAARELSWNCGVEGETGDAEVRALRARQQRNLLATLMLSHGTPMLLAGDELGQTQRGNNNPYCQDGELTWLDWELDEARHELLRFTQRLIRLRRRWLRGAHEERWLHPDGSELVGELPRTFALVRGDMRWLINAGAHRVRFVLPERGFRVILDTAGVRPIAGDGYPLAPHALAVLACR